MELGEGNVAEKRVATESSPPPAKRQQTAEQEDGAPSTGGAKPILVVLPGSSSYLAQDMQLLLMPLLEDRFDVRVRPGSNVDGGKKWAGWDAGTNAAKVVNELGLCPMEEDAAPWYVLGCSFGNRVACFIVSDGLTPVAPGLILMGYPMYGPGDNNKEARVEQIQALPASAKVLAISGGKDPALNKDAPDLKGQELWDSVVAGMQCDVTVKLNEKGGHGVYEGGKSEAAKARHAQATTNFMQWIHEFTSNV